jgi:hypothetical protein
LESVLEKTKAAQINAFVLNNNYSQKDLAPPKPMAFTRQEVVVPAEKISLKKDWMKFFNNTMNAMYSKISL